MFSFGPSSQTRLLAAGCLLLLAGIWWATRPDAKEAFRRDVEGMLQKANAREHHRLLDRLSPEADARIREEFMPPAAALRWICQRDTDQNRVYRLVGVTVFHPGDYAEVEIERSQSGAEFNGQGIFPLPFVWRAGKWWLAAAFRGERDWTFPE
ncbi:MAG: hypothetical protein SFU85_00550 [Candidatus Methylacidiphilales bacterium]|nr:hypothetical protein [Candidatus Methylacidiphilales bacterium]